MKWTHIALLTAPAVLALPSQRPLLQLQSDLLKGATDAEVEIAELNVEAFQTIQKEFTGGYAHLSDAAVDAANELIEAVAVDGAKDVNSHRGPHYIDFTQYTILEILNASLHHHHEHAKDNRPRWLPRWGRPKPPTDPSELPLHRLGWLVNRSSEVQELLGKDKITLLAPDDGALTPPHRRGHGHRHHRSVDGEAKQMEVELREETEAMPMGHPFHTKLFKGMRHAEVGTAKDGDDDDDDRARKISKIIGYIGAYHILEHVETGYELANHSTVGTSLSKQRIHVDTTWALHPFPHPTLKFNFYSYKRGLSIKAKNGIIHLISAPLLPPLSPLNEAFLFPTFFSTLTSSIQKVGLDEPLLPSHPHDDDSFDPADVLAELVSEAKEKGAPFTIFAPTNWAWNKVGFKGLAFLNSPFPVSKMVLKYILAYHVVPDIAFYSDFIDNSTSKSTYFVREETNVEVDASWLVDTSSVSLEIEPQREQENEASILPSWPSWGKKDPASSHPPHHHPHPHGKVNVTHYSLPTLLVTSGVNENATLPVVVVSYRRFGKGPVQRAVVVLPHHEHEHEHEPEEEHDEKKGGCGHHRHEHHGHDHHGPPPARPVKAIKADVPARNGAIHVVPTLLRPPHYHHSDDDKKKDGKSIKARKGRHGKVMAGFFA